MKRTSNDKEYRKNFLQTPKKSSIDISKPNRLKLNQNFSNLSAYFLISSLNSKEETLGELNKSKPTPPRFWLFFNESDFSEDFTYISSGNFSEVRKTSFQFKEHLKRYNRPLALSGVDVAIKDFKGFVHDWLEEQYYVSREIVCNMVTHPNLINYYGGVQLSSPQRVGLIMEYISIDLRTSIEIDERFSNFYVQLDVAKQIASGMNFLHSLNPYILHRDLRTPNILIREDFHCKIGDFGNANNQVYETSENFLLYSTLIPPEMQDNLNPKNFTKKADVYFFGWVLMEMLTLKEPDCKNLQEFEKITNSMPEYSKYTDLIYTCIHKNPDKRYSFNEICIKLNELLDKKIDFEQIAQNLDNTSLEVKSIEFNLDQLNRHLVHQCCIFGNLKLLENITNQLGKCILNMRDADNLGLAHFAARNGHLHILKYLEFQNVLSCHRESRFQLSPLDLAITMKHWDCIHFLISKVNQEALDFALLSAAQEGDLQLVQLLVKHGANLECHMLDFGGTPLERAAYHGHLDVVKFLISSGAVVDQLRQDGTSPLYVACQNGHSRVTEYLLDCGANVNHAHEDGRTSLWQSSQNNHPEVVKLLLSRGADKHKPRKTDGASPLLQASSYGNVEVVKLLLEAGANPNQLTNDGNSPLLISSYQGHLEIVKLLLNYGADVFQKFNGSTSSSWSRHQQHKEVTEILINWEQKCLEKKKA